MIVPDSFVCPECGECVDCQLTHSSCCAKAERTRGHYAVTKACFERFSYADPTYSIETTGLSVLEPSARSADIFTGAACAGRETAIDVTAVSTEVGDPDAGDDHLKGAFQRRTQSYAQIIVNATRIPPGLVLGACHVPWISGMSWAILGPFWSHLGAILGHLGASWGHLGHHLGPSWG